MDYYDDLFWKMALKDDEESFRTLFYQFFAPLCVYAMRYVPNREDCEDIVQDTFLKIWKTRKSMEISRSFRNFLIIAVKNACIDHLRKQESEFACKEQFIENHTAESPEDLYAVAELERMLNAALAKLPDNIRVAFEMNRFEGKTYSEIAEEQNLSVKTVEAYMTRALKLLRNELKDFLPVLLLFLYDYF
ncbi:MAG: RNA polymerase sigma-70 factor [Tannerella sp.]|jgi:RNA polymerase sigma-70 factor (ECF subfamily)|nr:RNA polymerase sigma-70 factor [Tannerella sp.]